MIVFGAGGSGSALALGLPIATPTLSPLPSILPTASPTPISLPPPTPPPLVPANQIQAPTTTAPSGGSTTTQQPASSSGSSGSSQSTQTESSQSAATPSQGERTDPRHQSDYQDEQEAQRSERAYRQQEAQVLAQLPALEAKYQKLALAAGGGTGRFGLPELVNPNDPPPITQPFGCSELMGEPYDPDCPTKHMHTGIDIAGPFTTPVFAPDDGVASVFNGTSGYGNFIVLTHGHGYSTLFGHLDKVLVHEGDLVHRGDVIGLEGSTGYSTGPHLHFEIRYHQAFVDPCAELDCSGKGGDAHLLAAKVFPAAPPTEDDTTESIAIGRS
jgi:murein DD-endopeptidase MepM/ murein hydrolase activator NlpD